MKNFLLSSAARGLSIAQITALSDCEILQLLKTARWGKSNHANEVICPHCSIRHTAYFISSRQQWQCKHCQYRFSITAGTIFQGSKLTLRQILIALQTFAVAAKGLSAIYLSHLLNIQYKTAWVLLHKFRETLNQTRNQKKLQGEVHIDGAYFNYYLRPKNFKHHRIDRRKKRHQRKDKSCILVFRQKATDQTKIQGADRTLVALIKEENAQDVLSLTTKLVAQGTKVCADETPAYDNLAAYYDLSRVNHSQEYCSIDGITNNLAESYFARLKRMLIGVHHKMSNKYLMLYATEAAWREDTRRQSVKAKFENLLQRSMQTKPLKDFINYWQGNKKGKEKYGVESLGLV